MVLFFSSIWNFSVYKIIDNDFPGGSDDKESACNAWGMCLIPRSGRSPGEGISKLKWTGMGEFNSDDQYIYYCRQESLKKKKWSSPHSQQQSLKCSTWVQSQKWQNDLCSFAGQISQ